MGMWGLIVGSSEGDQMGVVPGINVGCIRDTLASVLTNEPVDPLH